MKTKILFPLFILIFFACTLFAADGVFTNLRATNSTLTNVTATYINTAPVFLNCSSHDQTYTLPASGSRSIMKLGTTANVVNIVPSVVGHTIMGLSSYTLDLEGSNVELFLVGTTWYRK